MLFLLYKFSRILGKKKRLFYYFIFSTIYLVKKIYKRKDANFQPFYSPAECAQLLRSRLKIGASSRVRRKFPKNFQEASFNEDWGFVQCIFTLGYFGMVYCFFDGIVMVYFPFIRCIFYFSIPCFIHFSCRSRSKFARKLRVLPCFLTSQWMAMRKLISRARGNSGFSFIMLWVLVLFFFLYFFIYIYI